jgi:kynureninase
MTQLGQALLSRADCIALDKNDPLVGFKSRFALQDGEIYLDGNSLGALPKAVVGRMQRAISDEWGNGLIRSWNDAGWYPAPQRTGAKIARLIGADSDEVIVCDSTSVNLFKVLVAASRLRPDRTVLLVERGNFPTDVYVAGEAGNLLGLEVLAVAPDDVIPTIAKLGDRLAIVQLTEVNYKSGRVYDMARITAEAHKVGALTIWDLCHSAGALPVRLSDCQADFAIGCGYKYLNGGPGAPAYVFVARRHLPAVRNPIAGWHGHARPFEFTHEFEPHRGIDRMLAGTAPQLSLLALEEAVSVFDDVNMEAVRTKNQALGDLFIRLVDQELAGFGFGLASPRNSAERGSQVSLVHGEGYAIVQTLIAAGVIGDFRAPDIMRFGFAALYIGYEDIWESVSRLRTIMEGRVWDDPRYKTRKAVT